jgi:hypothetical protein
MYVDMNTDVNMKRSQQEYKHIHTGVKLLICIQTYLWT